MLRKFPVTKHDEKLFLVRLKLQRFVNFILNSKHLASCLHGQSRISIYRLHAKTLFAQASFWAHVSEQINLFLQWTIFTIMPF